jgi:alpha-D-ribose 1-methylphosphonate 5-phosphate C-P lyase
MSKPKIKIGSYYEFKLSNDQKIAFAVLYGFEIGRNKDVYAVRMYTKDKDFEFSVNKHLFKKWIDEKRVKEITSDALLTYIT